MQTTPAYQAFVELFPVKEENIGPLSAYKLILDASNDIERVAMARRIGGKLTYRLGGILPGTWVWSNGRVLTDIPANPVKLMMQIEELRASFDLYAPLAGIEEDDGWAADATTISDFVVRGSIVKIADEIQQALTKTPSNIPNVRVDREFRARAWEVNGQPAVSLAANSRLIYENDIESYAENQSKITDLIGLGVIDRTSSLQGEIIKIVGQLGEQRERLLGLTQREEMAEIINGAPDTRWVVRIQSGRNEYDYVSDALAIIIRLEDVERFGIDSAQAERALHLKPAQRAQMVKAVSDVVKTHGLIGDAYTMNNAPALFSDITPQVRLRFGGSKTRDYVEDRLLADLLTAGPFKPRDVGTEAQVPLRINLINAGSEAVDDFLEAMSRQYTRDFNQQIEIVRERKMRVASRANLESAVRLLTKEPADVLLIFLPDSEEDGDDEGISDNFSLSQTIGRGEPCFIIHEHLMHQPDAMIAVITGLLARAGTTPYILENPLEYADRIVGLTLSKQERRQNEQWTGFARIYRSDGLLLSAATSVTQVDFGASLPDTFWEQLLPRNLLAHKRVIVHYDGRLRRELLRVLGGWEDEIEATFYPVEVIQKGVPRLYAFHKGAIEPALQGTAFRLNDGEAFVMTSVPDIQVASMPLHVRTEPPLTIDQAVHSVMVMSLLHYGALKRPRLPVTLHHGEIVIAGLERGVMPADASYETPFWL
ncbi:MAG: hypothetical protein IAE89_10230 [Anaerolineae bacterium]|nr:hypothetical protein [Anaerolineae bacterium]